MNKKSAVTAVAVLAGISFGSTNRYIPEEQTVTPAVSIETDQGTLKLSAYEMLSGSLSMDDKSGFNLVGADVGFESKFIRSRIQVEMYTVDSLNGINPRIPQEYEYDRFTVARHEPIEGGVDFNLNLPAGWLEFYHGGFSLRTGKQKLRWGPGYKGTLSESGSATAPFYYYHITQKIAHIAEFQAFLRGYEDETHLISSADDEFTISSGAYTETIKGFPPRYGAGQLIRLNIGQHFNMGLYELVDFFGTNDLNRFANPFQIYYLGNNTSTNNHSNMMGGLFVEAAFKNARAYADFLNDDITIFEKTGNPNKYALQAGAEYLGEKTVKRAGAEYTHITRYAYGHYSVLSRHKHWAYPMAWPWGNDMDNFNVHVETEPMKNLSLDAQINYWILGQKGMSDDWMYDGMPNRDSAPYLPEHPDHLVSALVSTEYQPIKCVKLGIHWRPYWYNSEFGSEIHGTLTVPLALDRKVNLKKNRDK